MLFKKNEGGNKMLKKLSSLAVLFVFAVILCCISPVGAVQAQVVTGEKFIRVSGQAEIKVKPDIAIINLGVETRDESALAASQENARLTDALVKALQDFGIQDTQMKTGSFYIFTDREVIEPIGSQNAYHTFYRAVNEITVTLSNLDQVGALIDTAVSSGANRINSLNFEVRQADQVKLKALQEAALQSQAKASAIAQVLGINITGIKSLTEENSYYTPFRADYAKAPMAGGDMALETQILPGDVVIYAQVMAEFSF